MKLFEPMLDFEDEMVVIRETDLVGDAVVVSDESSVLLLVALSLDHVTVEFAERDNVTDLAFETDDERLAENCNVNVAVDVPDRDAAPGDNVNEIESWLEAVKENVRALRVTVREAVWLGETVRDNERVLVIV